MPAPVPHVVPLQGTVSLPCLLKTETQMLRAGQARTTAMPGDPPNHSRPALPLPKPNQMRELVQIAEVKPAVLQANSGAGMRWHARAAFLCVCSCVHSSRRTSLPCVQQAEPSNPVPWCPLVPSFACRPASPEPRAAGLLPTPRHPVPGLQQPGGAVHDARGALLLLLLPLPLLLPLLLLLLFACAGACPPAGGCAQRPLARILLPPLLPRPVGLNPGPAGTLPLQGKKNPVLSHPAVLEISQRLRRTPGQVVLRWALQHGQVCWGCWDCWAGLLHAHARAGHLWPEPRPAGPAMHSGCVPRGPVLLWQDVHPLAAPLPPLSVEHRRL